LPLRIKDMFSLYDKIPNYLLEKPQLVTTVLFAALFSIICILLTIPVSNIAWFELRSSEAFAFTLAFFMVCVGVVVISKRLMYSVRLRSMTYLNYILWCLAEAGVIALLYTFFTLEGAGMGAFSMEEAVPWKLFLGAFLFAGVCLGVPYIVAAQYFALEDKNNTIRMLNYSNVVSDERTASRTENRINLFDNNGLLKFSIREENLYFIEADDNYIQAWYLDSDERVKQYMLRCRLKTIEDSFAGSNLVRCHRKYIVNITKVRVLKGEDKGYLLDMDLESVDPIPVSKTYEQAVLARFNSR